jgi:ectoine hydroxylase-related dioxygenase (phytanoyl-CoA dioxygenase family)
MREAYQSKGYLTPIDVLSIEEAAIFRNEYEKWAATLPEQSPVGDLRFKSHLHLPFVSDVAIHNRSLVGIVQNILGTPNVLLWSSDFNTKPPHSDGFFSLHQDATYTGMVPAKDGVTVWLAISDRVDRETGCLAFVEGSHRWGQLPHVEGKITSSSGVGTTTTTKVESIYNDYDDGDDADNMLSRNQRVDLEDDRTRQILAECTTTVHAPLRAGQASLHHFYLVHASGPNRSDRPRIGLALRYIAASVRSKGKIKEAITVVAGKPVHDHFDTEPILPPSHECTPNDIQRGREAHKESMRREVQNYFGDTDDFDNFDDSDKAQ